MEQQTIGAKIAALRKKKGFTQLELAKQMHVTDKAVSKWERDKAVPDVHSIPKLAELLGTDANDLLAAAPQGKPTVAAGQVRHIISLILKVIPLAMGVAVTVLAILDEISVNTAATLLGIGLFCIALYLLDHEDEP